MTTTPEQTTGRAAALLGGELSIAPKLPEIPPEKAPPARTAVALARATIRYAGAPPDLIHAQAAGTSMAGAHRPPCGRRTLHRAARGVDGRAALASADGRRRAERTAGDLQPRGRTTPQRGPRRDGNGGPHRPDDRLPFASDRNSFIPQVNPHRPNHLRPPPLAAPH